MTTTPEKIVYTAAATTVGGRRGGHATSSDGNLDLELNAPQEPGGPGTGTNPEQLFAAGYSACFNSAFVLVAKQAGVRADAAGDRQGRLRAGRPGLRPHRGPRGRRPRARGRPVQELAEVAHQVCPYSNAIRGNVPTTVTAVAA